MIPAERLRRVLTASQTEDLRGVLEALPTDDGTVNASAVAARLHMQIAGRE